MARRFILSDDLTGVESDDVKNHVYMVDNVFYEVDLSADSFALFEKAIAEFVTKSRVTRRITATAKGEATKAEEIRQWAKARGMEVAERGRLSDEIVEAYDKEHSDNSNSDSENGADDAPDSDQGASSDTPDSTPDSANDDSEKASDKRPTARK